LVGLDEYRFRGRLSVTPDSRIPASSGGGVRDRLVHRLEKRRDEVDVAERRRDASTVLDTRNSHQEWSVCRLLEHASLSPASVAAHQIAVIARERDDSIVVPAVAREAVEDVADVGIDETDQPPVVRDGLPPLVLRRGTAPVADRSVRTGPRSPDRSSAAAGYRRDRTDRPEGPCRACGVRGS